MSGVLPSKEFNDQIVRVVRQVLREERGNVGRKNPTGVQGPAFHWAIANADIAAASNALSGPSTGEVELLQMDHSAATWTLSRSGVTHTATNRWEHISVLEDTLLVIMRLNGEWILIGADCDILASPPA